MTLRRVPLQRGDKLLTRRTPLAPGRPLTRSTPLPRPTSPLPRQGALGSSRESTPTRKPLKAVRRDTGPTRATRTLLAAREGSGICVISITCAGQPRPLVPHHRRNRGMGGSKDPSSNGPANLLEVCRECNGLMEDEACPEFYANGWKVPGGVDPASVPVLWPCGGWFLLDSTGGRTPVVP